MVYQIGLMFNENTNTLSNRAIIKSYLITFLGIIEEYSFLLSVQLIYNFYRCTQVELYTLARSQLIVVSIQIDWLESSFNECLCSLDSDTLKNMLLSRNQTD
jgi:hypothetical protein